MTRPLRAIADLAAMEGVSRDIITQALAEARSRGLVIAMELRVKAARTTRPFAEMATECGLEPNAEFHFGNVEEFYRKLAL